MCVGGPHMGQCACGGGEPHSSQCRGGPTQVKVSGGPPHTILWGVRGPRWSVWGEWGGPMPVSGGAHTGQCVCGVPLVSGGGPTGASVCVCGGSHSGQ